MSGANKISTTYDPDLISLPVLTTHYLMKQTCNKNILGEEEMRDLRANPFSKASCFGLGIYFRITDGI